MTCFVRKSFITNFNYSCRSEKLLWKPSEQAETTSVHEFNNVRTCLNIKEQEAGASVAGRDFGGSINKERRMDTH